MNDPDRTSRRPRALAGALFGVLVAVVVGVVAYNAGVSHGLAPGPHPWGFGFGFFFPLLFGFLLLRLIFWGGHGHRWHPGPGYCGAGPYDVPPAFEEWHRRAHERGPKGPDATGV